MFEDSHFNCLHLFNHDKTGDFKWKFCRRWLKGQILHRARTHLTIRLIVLGLSLKIPIDVKETDVLSVFKAKLKTFLKDFD